MFTVGAAVQWPKYILQFIRWNALANVMDGNTNPVVTHALDGHVDRSTRVPMDARISHQVSHQNARQPVITP